MNNTSSSNKNNNIDGLFHVTEDSYVDEESGWTAYLDDFSCSNHGSFVGSPSLVSDAAWYGSDNLSQVKRLKFNNLKRSRNNNNNNNNRRKFSLDDDLKDTASSPVNSPKASTLKQMEMINHPRVDDVAVSNFLGKEVGGSGINFTELMETTGEKNGTNVVNRRNTDDQYNDLRQKGLCVVPMSSFINYFG